MKYITPIYDRTITDITNKTAKAFFNVLDWQRVNNNTQVTKILVDFLLSISVSQIAVTEPTIATIPTVTELNNLLSNIDAIRAASSLPAITGLVEVPHDWIEGIAAESPDYTDANLWEQVLSIIYETIVLSAEYVIYCGVAASGQPRFYQHRFRQWAWVENSMTPVRRARMNTAICGAGLKRNNGYRRY